MIVRTAKQNHPREEIGLVAAHDGDIAGLVKFLNFVHAELHNVTVWPGYQKPVADRLRRLAREIERSIDFFDGYRAAKPKGGRK